eukprot:gene1610-1872_t
MASGCARESLEDYLLKDAGNQFTLSDRLCIENAALPSQQRESIDIIQNNNHGASDASGNLVKKVNDTKTDTTSVTNASASAAAVSSSPAPEALTVMGGEIGQSTSDHANADQICLDEDQVTGVANDFTEPSSETLPLPLTVPSVIADSTDLNSSFQKKCRKTRRKRSAGRKARDNKKEEGKEEVTRSEIGGGTTPPKKVESVFQPPQLFTPTTNVARVVSAGVRLQPSISADADRAGANLHNGHVNGYSAAVRAPSPPPKQSEEVDSGRRGRGSASTLVAAPAAGRGKGRCARGEDGGEGRSDRDTWVRPQSRAAVPPAHLYVDAGEGQEAGGGCSVPDCDKAEEEAEDQAEDMVEMGQEEYVKPSVSGDGRSRSRRPYEVGQGGGWESFARADGGTERVWRKAVLAEGIEEDAGDTGKELFTLYPEKSSNMNLQAGDIIYFRTVRLCETTWTPICSPFRQGKVVFQLTLDRGAEDSGSTEPSRLCVVPTDSSSHSENNQPNSVSRGVEGGTEDEEWVDIDELVEVRLVSGPSWELCHVGGRLGSSHRSDPATTSAVGAVPYEDLDLMLALSSRRNELILSQESSTV